ncbi:MAG: transcriptional regulator [Xanthobacteraceae bacterium]|nr:MAG: transcriptional regulator [Xanthobacteraceae bacterium]
MNDGPQIVGIAGLIGERARAEMLTAMLADRALTARELAEVAGVSKQTASAHLARLVEAGLIAVRAEGRHRYFRLADADVAQLLEALMGVAFRTGALRLRSSPREPALRKARSCYDHLAGELAVMIYESLLRQRALQWRDGSLELTTAGYRRFQGLGIDAADLSIKRRPVCRACLDWSERRHHLAGTAGTMLLRRILELGWATRPRDSRVIRFSAAGERSLRACFSG